jgi:hypothetical protein
LLVKRCIKCLLPDTYPGITFNTEGVCNYCINRDIIQYLGDSRLIKDIEQFLKHYKNRNPDYDCVISFSGGRDSSYLLYWFTQVIHLRVLAYSSDNGFIPETTYKNMKNITDSLNVKLFVEHNDNLKKCYKHAITAWMRRPTLPMIETFCTGCRLGIIRGSLNFALKNKIPVVIEGGTPFERVRYRENMMKIIPHGGMYSSLLGYSYQVFRNPKWILSANYLDTQIKEFLYYYYHTKIISASKILRIHPFAHYIRWEEKEVTCTITNKLNWLRNTGIVSTWRGDCDLAQLKLYLYKKALGFNDKLDHLSNLIRDGQISRADAMERLDKEETTPEIVIDTILDNLGISSLDFKRCISQIRLI